MVSVIEQNYMTQNTRNDICATKVNHIENKMNVNLNEHSNMYEYDDGDNYEEKDDNEYDDDEDDEDAGNGNYDDEYYEEDEEEGDVN